MNLPNTITSVRILLVPVYAWFHLADRPLAAIIVFGAAALSDGLDGLLARLLDQRTRLGAILDPIADKLLGGTALVLLVISETLPLWLLVAALLRDLVVVAVILTSKFTGRWLEAAPTRISKYATFALLTTVSLALASRAGLWSEALAPYLQVAAILAAECLLVAAAQYLFRWRALVRS